MADPQRAEAGSLRHYLRAANVALSMPHTARADIRQLLRVRWIEVEAWEYTALATCAYSTLRR